VFAAVQERRPVGAHFEGLVLRSETPGFSVLEQSHGDGTAERMAHDVSDAPASLLQRRFGVFVPLAGQRHEAKGQRCVGKDVVAFLRPGHVHLVAVDYDA